LGDLSIPNSYAVDQKGNYYFMAEQKFILNPVIDDHVDPYNDFYENEEMAIPLKEIKTHVGRIMEE
jgi:hypothetical protein